MDKEEIKTAFEDYSNEGLVGAIRIYSERQNDYNVLGPKAIEENEAMLTLCMIEAKSRKIIK